MSQLGSGGFPRDARSAGWDAFFNLYRASVLALLTMLGLETSCMPSMIEPRGFAGFSSFSAFESGRSISTEGHAPDWGPSDHGPQIPAKSEVRVRPVAFPVFSAYVELGSVSGVG